MNFNFELILFCAVIVSGVIALLDAAFFTPRRQKNKLKKSPLIIDYARSFFPILLLVFSARSFAYEPFRIPSGSLKPTLLIGDFILVNKFYYGIRLPVTQTKIFSIGEPKRGDIVVFREPPTESRDLIKRVIGLPGDHVSYKEKILYINGKEIPQQFEKYSTDEENNVGPWEVVQKQENLFGIKHRIYQIPNKENDDFDVIIPTGKYFMMGDNRDVSADSRSWGFLPEENIIGKATRVFMSYDTPKHPIRWDRVGKKIT
ncbi:signal peptidase I [soil metagenome]